MGDIVTIRLRDCTIQIAGIPHDLSAEEAERICRIVRAYASDTQAIRTHKENGDE